VTEKAALIVGVYGKEKMGEACIRRISTGYLFGSPCANNGKFFDLI
jgi:hypothetical protein